MEIGNFDHHGEIVKVRFKMPRKLKKRLKRHIENKKLYHKYSEALINSWQELKDIHATTLMQSYQERFF